MILQEETQNQPPEVFHKKGMKTFSQNLQENTCARVFFNKVVGPRVATLLKRDSGTGAFLWILQNF